MGAEALQIRETERWAPRAGLLVLAAQTLAVLTLAACAGGPKPLATGDGGAPTARYGGYKVGQPYQVKGVWYYPKDQPNYDEIGIASWYGEQFHNHYTADGEIFDMGMPSAAHKTLPLPSLVEVTNLANGRKVIVRVNDRGPFIDGRVIDMSKAAAEELGFVAAGVTKVRVRYVGRADAPPEPRQYQASNLSQPSLPQSSMSQASPTQSAPSLPKPSLPKVPFSLSPPPIQWAAAVPPAPPLIAPPLALPVSAPVVAPAPAAASTMVAHLDTAPVATSTASVPTVTVPASAIAGASPAVTTGAGTVLQPVSQTPLANLASQTQPSYVASGTSTATAATQTTSVATTTATGASQAAPVDDVSALLSDAAPAAASAAAGAASTAAVPAPVGLGYQLQAGVFASKANADALAARLSGVGSPQIEPIQRAGQTLYRVVVHGFSNPTTAAAARTQAAALGAPDARVVAAAGL